MNSIRTFQVHLLNHKIINALYDQIGGGGFSCEGIGIRIKGRGLCSTDEYFDLLSHDEKCFVTAVVISASHHDMDEYGGYDGYSYFDLTYTVSEGHILLGLGGKLKGRVGNKRKYWGFNADYYGDHIHNSVEYVIDRVTFDPKRGSQRNGWGFDPHANPEPSYPELKNRLKELEEWRKPEVSVPIPRHVRGEETKVKDSDPVLAYFARSKEYRVVRYFEFIGSDAEPWWIDHEEECKLSTPTCWKPLPKVPKELAHVDPGPCPQEAAQAERFGY